MIVLRSWLFIMISHFENMDLNSGFIIFLIILIC